MQLAALKGASALQSSRERQGFQYPASLRLKQGWEYDTLFRTGSRFKGRLVRLLFVESPDGTTRYGMAVGKRLAKSHLRNRGRRLLKESVRRLHPWVKDGVWIILSLNEQGLAAKACDVYADLAALMSRKGFMKDDWPGPVWH